MAHHVGYSPVGAFCPLCLEMEQLEGLIESCMARIGKWEVAPVEVAAARRELNLLVDQHPQCHNCWVLIGPGHYDKTPIIKDGKAYCHYCATHKIRWWMEGEECLKDREALVFYGE